MKDELKIMNAKIDNLEELTLFQRALLKDIHYFNMYQGKYIFIRKFIFDKYKNVIGEDEILTDVFKLESKKIIDVQKKKTIYNGNFRTETLMEINYNEIKTPLERVREMMDDLDKYTDKDE